MKVTPIRTFLLRQEGEPDHRKDVIAKEGIKIEVTDREHQQFAKSFVEPWTKKK